MAGKDVCKPLTDAEYAKCYSTFKNGSEQEEVVRSLVMPVLDKYANTSIDLLSIGIGLGWLEDDLVRHHHEFKVKSIHAIEPNLAHVAKLRETATNWEDTILEIDGSYFDEKYEISKQFDIILMIHSLYGMKNPINAIIKAKSFLKSGGKLLIFVQGEDGANVLVSRLFESVAIVPLPISDNSLTSKDISQVLHTKNIDHTLEKVKSLHNVTDFIERKETPTSSDVVSFLLQTNYKELKKELQEEIYQLVRDCSITDEQGRHFFNNPNCMIAIWNDGHKKE